MEQGTESDAVIHDYIVVSETEILLVNFSDKAAFISLNLETGEVKNKDEEYNKVDIGSMRLYNAKQSD